MIGLTRQRIAAPRGSSMEQPFGAFVMGGPWQVADLSRLLMRLAVALVLLLTAWYGSAGTTHVNHQLSWLAGGAAATAVALSATVAWTTSGMARVRYLKLEMIDAVRSRHQQRTPLVALEDPELRVAAPGMRLYHRPGCQLVVGKAVLPLTDLTGRRPCGVCER